MHKKVLSILLLLSAVAVFLGVAPTRCVAQENSEIEFRISSEKRTYITGEPIIITSVVTNKSNRVITVKEPTALGFVSAFTLEMGEGDKKRVFNHAVGFGRPAYWAANVELQPTKSSSNSCELSWQIGNEPLEGKCLLRACYYRSDYGAPDFSTNMLEAKPIEFVVVKASRKDKQAQSELSAAIETPDNQQKEAALKEFLARHLDSIYRVTALDELRRTETDNKDLMGKLDVYRQLLKEKISSSKREHTAFFAADTSVELGDIKGALEFLKDSTLPNSLLFKRTLEEKLK